MISHPSAVKETRSKGLISKMAHTVKPKRMLMLHMGRSPYSIR